MNDYYHILRIPHDASPEQIQHVYWKLAKIYAPDITEIDKAHATEEMKDINEAYAVLSNPSKRAEYDQQWEIVSKQSIPAPEVSLTQLDFGTLKIGRKETLKFTVDNRGASPQEINFVCSEENGWFTISSIKPSSSENPFPIDVGVSVDTERLTEGNYQGWIEVNTDGVTARTNLSVQIIGSQAAKASSPLQTMFQQFPRWAIVSATLVGVTGLGWLFFSFFGVLSNRVPVVPLPVELPSPTPIPPGQVVFSVIQNDLQILHTANADGTNARNLNVSGWSAVWSPDGRQIAFISDRADGMQQVYSVKPDGGSITRLTDMGGDKSALTWFQSGDSLAFVNTSDKKSTIYRVDSLGIKVQPMTEEQTGEITQITWSPDGKTLLFDVQSGNESRVHQFDIDSQQELQLTNFDSSQPAWSPGGKAIAVASKDGIYKMNADGKERLRLTTFPAWSPAWSSDGRYIAFLSDKGIAGQSPELWIMETDGSAMQRLTTTGCWEYVWANGNLIYLGGDGQNPPLSLQMWAFNLLTNKRLKIAELNQPYVSWIP